MAEMVIARGEKTRGGVKKNISRLRKKNKRKTLRKKMRQTRKLRSRKRGEKKNRLKQTVPVKGD